MKCGWRTAFIAQGESDLEIFYKLHSTPVEPCHYLHYLQMASEKIAKGLSCKDELTQPPETHHILVKWMRQLMTNKPHSDWFVVCRCKSFEQFKTYLQGLIGFASSIEAMAPDVAKKRGQGPNAEYPWVDAKTSEVRFPAEYQYSEIIKNIKFFKLIKFIQAAIEFAKIHP